MKIIHYCVLNIRITNLATKCRLTLSTSNCKHSLIFDNLCFQRVERCTTLVWNPESYSTSSKLTWYVTVIFLLVYIAKYFKNERM